LLTQIFSVGRYIYLMPSQGHEKAMKSER
jgi:hypothetical protein